MTADTRSDTSFELVIRPRRQGEAEIRRKVNLWADLGVFMKLKRDKEYPIDILGDGGTIERIATDTFLQGSLIYALSDAQDIEPEVFMSGFTNETAASAIRALRGALASFFLANDFAERAQALATSFEGARQVRMKLAETIRDSGITQQVIDALGGEELQGAIDATIIQAKEEMRRAYHRPGK